MLVFGTHADVANIVITGYLLAFIIGVYCLGWKLFKNGWAGLIAAVTLASAPLIFSYSRYFMLEIPLLAVLVWACYFLYQSKYLMSLKYVMPFALLMSIALLTKWTAVVFLFVPCLFVFVQACRKQQHRQILFWRNLAILVAVVLLVAGPWYFVNFEALLESAGFYSVGEANKVQNLYSAEALTFYINQFFNFQFQFWPALAVLIGSLIYSFKKEHRYKWLFWVIFIVSYIAFSSITNKNARYNLPAIIPLALMFGQQLYEFYLSKKWSVKIVAGILTLPIVWGLVSFLILSFGWLPASTKSFDIGPLFFLYHNTNLMTETITPNQDTSLISDITEIIIANRQDETQQVFTMLAVDQREINAGMFQYHALQQRISKLYFDIPYSRLVYGVSDEWIERSLEWTSYLIFPAAETGSTGTRQDAALQSIQNYVIRNPDKFVELGRFETDSPAGDIILFRVELTVNAEDIWL